MTTGCNPKTWLMLAGVMLALLLVSGCLPEEAAKPARETVVLKPLSIYILSPLNDDSKLQGDSIYFEADTGESSTADSQVVWPSNLDGEIGTAPKFQFSQLSACMHTITATIKDGMGQEAAHSLILDIEKFTWAAHYKKNYQLNLHKHKIMDYQHQYGMMMIFKPLQLIHIFNF